jgi:hypothetical protein
MLKVMNPNTTSKTPSTTYQHKCDSKIGASSHIISLPVDLSILISEVYAIPGLEDCTIKILMKIYYDFS